MIKNIDTPTEDYYIKGFEFEIHDNIVHVSSGAFVQLKEMFDPNTGDTEYFQTQSNYPAFEFEINPDKDFKTLYTIYLVDRNESRVFPIVVDGFIMIPGEVPNYSGEHILKYTLANLTVSSVDESEEISLEVRRAVLNNENIG